MAGVGCTDADQEQERTQPAVQPSQTSQQDQRIALTADQLAGLNLTQAMRAVYDSIASQYSLVCGNETGGPGVGGATGLEPGSAVPTEAADSVNGWTGTIWVGEFDDFELRDVNHRRILLVSADPVPPPHDGYHEPIATGVTLIKQRGAWDIGRIAHLFDCGGDSRQTGFQYESSTEVVDDEHGEPDEHSYSVLEVGDPEDWPPALDLPAIAEWLTATAREEWSIDFVCVSVTRRAVESGEAGTGLSADSPLPAGILAIFDELRYDPHQTDLRRIGPRNVLMGWLEPRGDAGNLIGVEFVRTASGEWRERTWVDMYGCDALGRSQ